LGTEGIVRKSNAHSGWSGTNHLKNSGQHSALESTVFVQQVGHKYIKSDKLKLKTTGGKFQRLVRKMKLLFV
jgi:hypothetical protein